MIRHTILVLFYLVSSSYLAGQCTRTVKVVFTSINYKSGCNFNDGGGIDASLDLFELADDRIYNSHYGDQSQVTGPQDSVAIDFNITVNPCGNFSNSFTLGTFPIEMESYDVRADTYEKSSNFLNNQCSTYNILFDDNYSTGIHTFNFLMDTGTLDVGGCMTYNYELQITFAGELTIDFLGPICATDTLYISNNNYHFDNPKDNFMVAGLPNFCDTIFNIDLTFYDPIDVQINGPSAICLGQEQELSLNQSFQTYLWNDGSNLSNLKIDTAGIYTITVTSIDGCTKVAEIAIAENPSPSLIIQGEDTFCSESFTQLIAVSGSNQTLWNTGETTDTITIATAGTYVVTLTNANGCASSDSLIITESLLPQPMITGDATFCEGDSTTLMLIENYASYLWNDLSTEASLVVSITGDYFLTVTDANGCTGSSMIAVEQHTLPDPTLSGKNNICAGIPIPLVINESYVSYEWNTGETSNTIMVDTAGDYTVVVTDLNGCTSSTSQTVTVSDQLNPTITGKIEICEGETNTISVADDLLNYLWQDGSTEQERIASDAGVYSVTVTDINGCTGSSSVMVSVLQQNIQQVNVLTCYPDSVGIEEVIIPNASGCDDIVVYTISLDNEIQCGIGYHGKYTYASCEGSGDGNYNLEILQAYFPVAVELYDMTGNNFFSAVYDETDTNIDISNLAQGDYELILTTENDHVEKIIIEMRVAPNLPVEVPPSLTAIAGDMLSLAASLDLSLFELYYWAQDGLPLCPDNCSSSIITVEETTIYEFYAKQANTDCEYLLQTEVIVDPPKDLYIPTIFALSGLAEDEKFTISGPGTSSISSLSIYDRWGNLIHQTDGTDPSWDGRYNGQALKAGVFIYVIEMSEGALPLQSSYKTGSITLLN